MKKLLAFILALVLLCTLVACDSGTSGNGINNGDQSNGETNDGGDSGDNTPEDTSIVQRFSNPYLRVYSRLSYEKVDCLIRVNGDKVEYEEIYTHRSDELDSEIDVTLYFSGTAESLGDGKYKAILIPGIANLSDERGEKTEELIDEIAAGCNAITSWPATSYSDGKADQEYKGAIWDDEPEISLVRDMFAMIPSSIEYNVSGDKVTIETIGTERTPGSWDYYSFVYDSEGKLEKIKETTLGSEYTDVHTFDGFVLDDPNYPYAIRTERYHNDELDVIRYYDESGSLIYEEIPGQE